MKTLDAPVSVDPDDWLPAGDTITAVERNVTLYMQGLVAQWRAEGRPERDIERALAMQRRAWERDRPTVERNLVDSAAATKALLRSLGFAVEGQPGRGYVLRTGTSERRFAMLHEALTWATRT